jgi:hypothetical protein
MFQDEASERIALTFGNPAGYADNTPEYDRALADHIEDTLLTEKRARVAHDKDAVCQELADQFPGQIVFLSSMSTKQKLELVGRMCNIHPAIKLAKEELEDSQKIRSVEGVSATTSRLLKDEGLLETYMKLRKDLCTERSQARQLQGEFARTATMMGKYAVRSLDRDLTEQGPEVTEFIAASTGGQSLPNGGENAVLELFNDTKVRSRVRKSLQAVKAHEALLGCKTDHTSDVVALWLRFMTKVRKLPVNLSNLIDLAQLCPKVFQRKKDDPDPDHERNTPPVVRWAYQGYWHGVVAIDRQDGPRGSLTQDAAPASKPAVLDANGMPVEAELDADFEWVDAWAPKVLLAGKSLGDKGKGKGI